MPLAEIVFKVFQTVLFKPLLTLVSDYNAQFDKEFSDFLLELKNASDTPLMAALRTGLVQYKNGVFTGSFSRAISSSLRSIGARFDKRTGTYQMDAGAVPVAVRSEAAAYEVNAKRIHEAIIGKLNEIQTGLDKTFDDLEVDTGASLSSVEAGFEKSARALAIEPTLTPKVKEVLREEYSENIKLFVKNFTASEIASLRGETEKNATAGYRFDRLAETIQDRYKTSAAKAEFLARQETSLFMSKYHEARYGQAGVTRYIWRTSRDSRVRDSHRHLEGKVFFFGQPPIVDKINGRRAQPGEDFGCRCMAEPILDPIAVGS